MTHDPRTTVGKTLVLCSIPPRRPTDKPDEAWSDLAELTCATHRKYCERWGYSYHLDVSDLAAPVGSRLFGKPVGPDAPIRYFVKFKLFQHFLDPESCRKEWDHVVWFDADLVITDYETPLEKFFNNRLANEPDAIGDIVLTNDINGLHATVIMIRRTPTTLGFVWACGNAGMTYFHEDGWSDQLAMRMFLMTPPYANLVWYHSVKTLCAMPPGVYPIPPAARKIYEWDQKESLALHLSALSIPKRIELAKRWIEEYGLLP